MRGHHTNIRTDSTRTTAYINRQQGLGYPHLCKMSAKLWQWTDPLFCTQSRTCAMIIQRQGRHNTEKGPKSRRLDHICHLFRKAALLPKKKERRITVLVQENSSLVVLALLAQQGTDFGHCQNLYWGVMWVQRINAYCWYLLLFQV